MDTEELQAMADGRRVIRHQDGVAMACELLAVRDALENLTIAIGMGWDLGGVTEVARTLVAAAKARCQA